MYVDVEYMYDVMLWIRMTRLALSLCKKVGTERTTYGGKVLLLLQQYKQGRIPPRACTVINGNVHASARGLVPVHIAVLSSRIY